MCGIAGIIRFNSKPVSLEEIDFITDTLAHRGPDGRGVWRNEKHSLALGHRRLSILDLSENGQQPMITQDGSLIIILNGEIYNFLEIRQQLKNKGYQFCSETDTEVILYAYREWGLDMLHKFNGMWAFALYDQINEITILSRDRYGIKPIYYFKDEKELVFASEVKSLQKLLKNKVSINEKVIQNILDFNQDYHGTEDTYLKEVKSLPSGHNLLITNKNIKLTKWYELPQKNVPKRFEDQIEELRGLFIDSCKLRLRSDVDIATCLSGGIDSGSISSIINTFNANEDKRFSHFTHSSYCAGFPGIEFDETNEAVRLANQLNLKLDVHVVKPPNVVELEEALNATDGPMPALSFFPIWSLYRHIKNQGITVTLDGQGADEMLGGYYKGYDAMLGAWEMKNLKWFKDVRDTYSALNPNAPNWVQSHYKSVKQQVYRDLDQALKYPIKKILHWANLYQFNNDKKRNESYPNYISNSFDKALYNQFFINPLPFLLHQYDRASMANSIECRMPFMDYRLVEFIFSLPPQSKVGGGYTKRILRETVNGILPNETRLNKTKTGFNAPTIEWFKSDLHNWFMDEISNKSFLENKFFDGKSINKEFSNAILSKNPNSFKWKFWSFIHVNWWLNNS